MSLVKKRAFGQKRKQLEADIEHVTAEMYKRNFELSEINKTLSLLHEIDDALLSSNLDLKDLCSKILGHIHHRTGYDFLGLYLQREAHDLEELAQLSKYPDKKSILNSIRQHTAHWDSTENKAVSVESTGVYKRIYLYEVRTRGEFSIIFAVGFQLPDAQLTDHDHMLMTRLRDSVGLVIESKMLSDENKLVLKQLERSNQKLKALDEAKDEFISMASHQLRTPLTSIKGYLSMVLEGDVGTITDQQREMLNTAYTSSQRMVYLIADLLNVSRLQTGKFVIEPVDTYLPTVVEEELKQLKEAASAKNITIDYSKPEEFPTMTLDETKIRQVIMNFADNALYYTPAGGKVVIHLQEKSKSIEFTITDDGIGVPKAEQHKLFGKFFRAGNARKARPDGTGLGLFMAKKVIVSSGGALIFKSKEGKGSTFGFTFPKS